MNKFIIAEGDQERRESAATALGRRRFAGVDAPADAGAVPHLRNAADLEVSRNLKTALLLGFVALTTFCAIIAKYYFIKL